MLTEYIAAITLFVMMNAFFAGSEAALTSLNKIRLRHLVESGNAKAVLIHDFLTNKNYFLGTTLVGTNIAVIISSALATKLFSLWFGRNAPVISTIVMTLLILVFGEVIPKTIFRQSSNAISMRIISPLKLMFRMFYPVIFLVTAFTNVILRPLMSREKRDQKPFLSKKDIETVLRISSPSNLTGAGENNLIERIFKLGTTRIGDIMIPLNQATLINADDSIERVKTIAASTRFSRFPVYETRINNIIGTINIYDILFDKEEKVTLKEYLKAPVSIRKSEPVDEVLARLRNKKKPMTIVVDDKEHPVGIITIEDLLEEIVGEIEG